MGNNSKIYIAGHKGMVGSALVRNLQSKGYNNLLTVPHSELDLLKQNDVQKFFEWFDNSLKKNLEEFKYVTRLINQSVFCKLIS